MDELKHYLEGRKKIVQQKYDEAFAAQKYKKTAILSHEYERISVHEEELNKVILLQSALRIALKELISSTPARDLTDLEEWIELLRKSIREEKELKK